MSRFSIRATFGADTSQFNAALSSAQRNVAELRRGISQVRGVLSIFGLSMSTVATEITDIFTAAKKQLIDVQNVIMDIMQIKSRRQEDSFLAELDSETRMTVLRDFHAAALQRMRRAEQNRDAKDLRRAFADVLRYEDAIRRERETSARQAEMQARARQAERDKSFADSAERIKREGERAQRQIEWEKHLERERAKAAEERQRRELEEAERMEERRRALQQIKNAEDAVTDAIRGQAEARRNARRDFEDRYLPTLGEMAQRGTGVAAQTARRIQRLEERSKEAALRGNVAEAERLQRQALGLRERLSGRVESRDIDPFAEQKRQLDEANKHLEDSRNSLAEIRDSLKEVAL